jgi:hypothetical protein
MVLTLFAAAVNWRFDHAGQKWAFVSFESRESARNMYYISMAGTVMVCCTFLPCLMLLVFIQMQNVYRNQTTNSRFSKIKTAYRAEAELKLQAIIDNDDASSDSDLSAFSYSTLGSKSNYSRMTEDPVLTEWSGFACKIFLQEDNWSKPVLRLCGAKSSLEGSPCKQKNDMEEGVTEAYRRR